MSTADVQSCSLEDPQLRPPPSPSPYLTRPVQTYSLGDTKTQAPPSAVDLVKLTHSIQFSSFSCSFRPFFSLSFSLGVNGP